MQNLPRSETKEGSRGFGIGTVALMVLSAFVTLFAKEAWDKMKGVTYQIAGFGAPRPAYEGTIVLEIAPRTRRRITRWWFSDDYVTTYAVLVTNQDIITPQRISIQVTAGEGYVNMYQAPPFCKAKIDGERSTEWSGSEDSRSVLMELELPPARARAELFLAIVGDDRFVTDGSVQAQLFYPGGVVEARATTGVWE